MILPELYRSQNNVSPEKRLVELHPWGQISLVCGDFYSCREESKRCSVYTTFKESGKNNLSTTASHLNSGNIDQVCNGARDDNLFIDIEPHQTYYTMMDHDAILLTICKTNACEYSKASFRWLIFHNNDKCTYVDFISLILPLFIKDKHEFHSTLYLRYLFSCYVV